MQPTRGYYTTGIDTRIAWPSKETMLEFRGRKFHLLPETDDVARMIRVETDSGFTQADADKLILEFLSALSWSEQANALPTYGNWCTAPLNIGKGTGASMIGKGHFDYLPDPIDPKAKLAIALYREGLSVNLVPYQFLGFFKVINVIRDKGSAQKQWIKDNLQHVTDRTAIARISALQSSIPNVETYLYESGRCAVAHAFDQSNLVNPDDPADLTRLQKDLPVIRELARVAIEREFGIKSKRDFHREHLYELDGFRTHFGETLVARIKSLGQIPSSEIPLPTPLSLRVRDREAIEAFESMDAAVVEVHDGCVRVRLDSTRHQLVVFVTLDFASESLISDPIGDVQFRDDGTPNAARMMLQWAQLYRWWFGGNGTIELWDTVRAQRMARSQPYMPPINSLFPHTEFEKLQAKLRARLSAADPAVVPEM